MPATGAHVPCSKIHMLCQETGEHFRFTSVCGFLLFSSERDLELSQYVFGAPIQVPYATFMMTLLAVNMCLHK